MCTSRAGLAWALPLVAALSGAIVPRCARAQPDETQRRTTAEALFAQAKELLASKDYARACPKLEEVNRILPGKIGATMTLAECYEAAGKTASARTVYDLADRLSSAVGDPRAKDARERALALVPRIPKLAIVVPEAARKVQGLWIVRDEMDVGVPQWGDAIPVDPGQHRIVASAPGKRPFGATIEVRADAGIVSVTIPVLEDENPKSSGHHVPALAGEKAARLPQDSRSPRGTPAWVWLTGGSGIVLLGAAAAFGIDGLSTFSTLKERCGSSLTQCPPRAEYDPTDDNARKNRDLALFIALGGAGMIALGSAAWGFVRSKPSPHRSPTAIHILPLFSPSTVWARVEGAF